MIGFKTAWDYYSEEHGKRDFQSTSEDNIDFLIGGGIAFGTLTEISGEAGCGKSQFCMQLAAASLAARRQVLYIDTENGSSLNRIMQLHSSISKGKEFPIDLLIQSSKSDVQELIILLTQFNLKERKPDIIILDSLTTPFKGENLKDLSLDLDNIAIELCKLATIHRAAVVCTNHVTTKFDCEGNSYINPSLGNFWSHRPTNRIWMHKEDQNRFMDIVKSPFVKHRSAGYIIKEEGICILNPELLKF